MCFSNLSAFKNPTKDHLVCLGFWMPVTNTIIKISQKTHCVMSWLKYLRMEVDSGYYYGGLNIMKNSEQ